MSTTHALLTAEEYQQLPDHGRRARTELVRGRIVRMNMPAPRHGIYCTRIIIPLGSYVARADLGQVASNDSGVITERDPDSVRGADISYYSFQRLPKGALPQGYLDVVPELVFEVLSVTDRWKDVLTKVAEYLEAGVSCVCLVDPQREVFVLYYPDQPEETLDSDQTFELPSLLPGFSLPLNKVFY